nr:hypothetical protein CFP56_20310 [Quercus suber]
MNQESCSGMGIEAASCAAGENHGDEIDDRSECGGLEGISSRDIPVCSYAVLGCGRRNALSTKAKHESTRL